MPVISPPATVLVTGANGYIGRWIVRELLLWGYSVRGAVRTPEKAQELSDYVSHRLSEANGRFAAYVVPDIAIAGAFNEATKGVDGIIHTASPVTLTMEDPQSYIKPVVEGLLNVLKGALSSRVKRVVITSFIASIISVTAPPGVYTERDWNNVAVKLVGEQGKGANPYFKYDTSKTLTECAAWDFVEEHRDDASFELCTIQPTWVYGPTAGEALASPTALPATPVHMYGQLFQTPPPQGLPCFNYVDVRDIADMHIRAFEVEAAGGQRVICNSKVATWEEFHAALGTISGFKVSDPQTESETTKECLLHVYLANDKVKHIFGIKFRAVRETMEDTVEDYRLRGWLQHIEA